MAENTGGMEKRVNGEIALCLEQGVALNVGENNGYTSSIQNTELLKENLFDQVLWRHCDNLHDGKRVDDSTTCLGATRDPHLSISPAF